MPVPVKTKLMGGSLAGYAIVGALVSVGTHNGILRLFGLFILLASRLAAFVTPSWLLWERWWDQHFPCWKARSNSDLCAIPPGFALACSRRSYYFGPPIRRPGSLVHDGVCVDIGLGSCLHQHLIRFQLEDGITGTTGQSFVHARLFCLFNFKNINFFFFNQTGLACRTVCVGRPDQLLDYLRQQCRLDYDLPDCHGKSLTTAFGLVSVTHNRSL